MIISWSFSSLFDNFESGDFWIGIIDQGPIKVSFSIYHMNYFMLFFAKYFDAMFGFFWIQVMDPIWDSLLIK